MNKTEFQESNTLETKRRNTQHTLRSSNIDLVSAFYEEPRQEFEQNFSSTSSNDLPVNFWILSSNCIIKTT